MYLEWDIDISTSTYSSASLFNSASSELRTIAPKYINTSSVDSAVSKSDSTSSDNATDSKNNQQSLQQSQAYQQVISELEARDQHVRAHERAHLSASGGYATGGASYTYQIGPDGRRYAVGGEVGIDTSPVSGDAEATVQKARIIQRAALAPSDPSSQDLRVHAQAVQMEMQASQEVQKEKEAAKAESNNSNNLSEGQNLSDGEISNSQGLEASRLNFEIRMKIGG